MVTHRDTTLEDRMAHTLKTILLVDDNEDDLFFYKKHLSDYTDIKEILEAKNIEDALSIIEHKNISCLLVDYMLRGESGLDLVKTLKHSDRSKDIPIILLTGQGNENVAIETMHLGVQDYMIKQNITKETLYAAIIKSIDKLHQEIKVEYLAFHDPLTGAYNRAYFCDYAQSAIERAFRYGYEIALLFIDLDHFKPINDKWGHDIGDEVLRVVANRLKDSIRKMDILARMGGDEFVILIENVKSYQVHYISQKILTAFHTPSILDGHSVPIQISLGFSMLPSQAKTLDELLKQGDLALYSVKKQEPGFYHRFQGKR
ncbi:MAG TPA: GGDEF domain-containing response regulator [Gammaproteobacteria bacterium]|nr:GGDEF domain-containing response regulator [Gammaproteobacteria bacterium]